VDNFLASDLYRYSNLKWSVKNCLIGLLIPGFRFTFFFRKVSNPNTVPIFRWFYRFIHKWLEFKYGFQIPSKTQIGKGLYIGHHGTIIINEKAILGDNCNIAPGVVIGQSNRGLRKGTPVIGNKVWIGVNSVIVGSISIGDNVLVAPCSYVNVDVPSNSIVIGNPAKIVSKEDATEGYITNVIN